MSEGIRTAKESFMKNTATRPSGCIEWIRFVAKNGYGHSSLNGKKDRVHRISYILHFGEIPKGKWVLHKCDNRKCVNPDHLYAGSHKDNTRDMIKRNRVAVGDRAGVNTHPEKRNYGEKCPLCKLKENQVIQIRDLHKKGFNYKSIAKLFGVDPTNISLICRRKTWKHLDALNHEKREQQG